MLYTIVMEFVGGTYISQITGRSVTVALRNWVRKLDYATVHGLGKKGKTQLVSEIEECIVEGPSPLAGLKNAWCTCALISNRLALIYIVATVLPIKRRPIR